MESKRQIPPPFSIAFLLILCLGLWLRVKDIDQRPMHGDEANQAHRFEILLSQNEFIYEPIDYHGPTLYFLTLPFAWITGLEQFEDSTKTFFRSVPVTFSILTAIASLLFLPVLKYSGTLAIALFIMISPAMVYYSTYYIQETLLICFSTLFLGCLLHYFLKPTALWACFLGLSLGLMQATKETFVLSMFALCFSLLYLKVKNPDWSLPVKFKQHILFSGLCALFVSILFYSSFFTHAKGPLDSILAFTHQLDRGLGQTEFEEQYTSGIAHSKSSNYYLNNIIGYYPKKVSSTIKSIYRNAPDRSITEVLFLALPLVGLLFLKKRSRFEKQVYLAVLIYSVILMLTYSLIPYKTPWCMLSFLLGFMFVSAMSLKFILEDTHKFRLAGLIILISILTIDLGRQASLINTEEFCVTDKNPYAYVQPYFDVENLSERIHQLSEVDGRQSHMPIHFLTSNYWPMPWYLKSFEKIGYWEEREPNLDYPNLPVVITTPDRDQLIAKLEATHTSEYRGRMPGYHYLVFYKNELWNQLHETH